MADKQPDPNCRGKLEDDGTGALVCKTCGWRVVPAKHKPKADRLSTPAASTGAAVQRFTPMDTFGGVQMEADDEGGFVRVSDYRELQARNAELECALDIASSGQECAIAARDAARAELTALLDGIEADPVSTVQRNRGYMKDCNYYAPAPEEMDGQRVYIVPVERIAALRESTVPAVPHG